MNANTLKPAIALILGTALASSAAFAAPPPGKGKPPTPGEETLGNNLSLPTKFVPAYPTTGAPVLRLGCVPHIAPGADGVLPQFSYEGYSYWVQKTAATWTADCVTSAAGIEVTADWGDNLVGEQQPKAGKPIRVEVNLADKTDPTIATGYAVDKLTPEVEDRLATYGTKGVELAQNYRVFDAGARLEIEKCADTSCSGITQTIFEGLIPAEINSIGAVVYGYNWGIKGGTNAPTPGTYRLTFFANNTTITGVTDAKASVCPTDNCTYVILTLGSGGGGGKPPKGK